MAKKAKREFHGKTENMGRPPMKPSERASARVTVRMTPAEREALELEAKQAGRTISQIIMDRLRKE